ncbi:hypothetical protein BH20VER3_BH20VER3_19490 [soil metagenome]
MAFFATAYLARTLEPVGFGIIGFANALSKGIMSSLLVRNETCTTDSRIMWKMKIGLLSAIVACALLPAHFARAEAIAVRSVVPEAFGDGQQPQVTVTPAGVIIVVFAKGQSIYSVQSSDQGENFSAPVKIADLPGLMVGMRRGPRVAATDKRIIVSAPGPELASYLSQDAGQTWKPAGKINDKPGAASEGLQNITALPDGSFYAVWLDSRNKPGAQIEGARLEPTVTSWSKNVMIYQSPDKSVCECCHPSVASDGKNRVVVMWRNWLGGNRDFYISESQDRGERFSPASKLDTESWPLKACPMDGGGIVAVSNVGNFAAWRRQGDVFLSAPATSETKLGAGAQPVLARVNGQTLCVWQQGARLAVKPENGEKQYVSGTYPSLVASPDGQRAYLVWESAEGNHTIPRFAVVR